MLNHLTAIIMKRINLLLFISLLFSSVSMAQEPYSIPESSLRIEFVCEHINNNAGQVGRPRTPIQPPTVYLCDHTLYICGDYGDFSLQVLTDDETAVYSTYVPSGTTEVQLPATLSDDYQAKVTGTGACCQALSPDCKVKISVPTTRPDIYVPFTAICG